MHMIAVRLELEDLKAVRDWAATERRPVSSLLRNIVLDALRSRIEYPPLPGRATEIQKG